MGQRPKIEIVSIEHVRALAPGPLDFGPPKRRFEGADDTLGQTILQIENIFEGTLEFFRPDVISRRAFDELAVDAHSVRRPAHAAFEHITDTQLLRDLADVHGVALVGEGGIAGDDEEPRHLGEVGDQVLDEAIGEIFLLRVAAHDDERHYRY